MRYSMLSFHVAFWVSSLHCSNPTPTPSSECIPTGSETEPNLYPTYQDKDDEDCDGIDGNRQLAIFVDWKTGNDQNEGTIENPVQTISYALQKAKNSVKSSLYISKGTYIEDVELVSGISLYGEYSAENGWKRDPSYVVTIQNTMPLGKPSIGVQGVNVVAPTTLSGITISAVDSLSLGESTYGLYCVKCPELHLIRMRILTGHGAPGANGADGAFDFTPTPSGTKGNNTTCDNTTGASGGFGGPAFGIQMGGKGGNGGNSNDIFDNGVMGLSGGGGAMGGFGGNGGSYSSVGLGGGNGSSATVPGAAGSKGNGGGLFENFWLSENGGQGSVGDSGQGGGGGGGSGAIHTLFFKREGNGGGGGGAGGAGGMGGFGGEGGGGSFAVFLIDSTGLILQDCVLQSGKGGAGGAGGMGAAGKNGGAGGVGGYSVVCSSVSAGGAGGKGGDGAAGGSGGGGAGGPSIALFQVNTIVQKMGTNELHFSTGGPGGFSSSLSSVGGMGVAVSEVSQ